MNLEARQTFMQEQLDALTNLVNAHDNEIGIVHALVKASQERYDALYDAFCRHGVIDAPGHENAVNAQETRAERERHA